MSKNDAPFIVPKRRKGRSLEESFHNLTGQSEIVKLVNFEYLVPNDNPYPITELEDLIESIKLYGVEQSLLVQKIEDKKYLIIGGHRRYFAVKTILENDKEEQYEELQQLYCKIIDKETDELIVKLRLHETNLQARPLLKMKEEEKLAVVGDYIELIQQARKQGIKINGKEVKGKTRDILAQQFNISPTQAGREIAKVNQKEEGVHLDTPPKTPKNKGLTLKKVLKNVKSIEQGLNEEEAKIVQEIIEVLEELM